MTLNKLVSKGYNVTFEKTDKGNILLVKNNKGDAVGYCSFIVADEYDKKGFRNKIKKQDLKRVRFVYAYTYQSKELIKITKKSIKDFLIKESFQYYIDVKDNHTNMIVL